MGEGSSGHSWLYISYILSAPEVSLEPGWLIISPFAYLPMPFCLVPIHDVHKIKYYKINCIVDLTQPGWMFDNVQIH